jgi:hypothetical protein
VERLYATEVYLHLFCISELMGVQRSVLHPRAQHGWGKSHISSDPQMAG